MSVSDAIQVQLAKWNESLVSDGKEFQYGGVLTERQQRRLYSLLIMVNIGDLKPPFNEKNTYRFVDGFQKVWAFGEIHHLQIYSIVENTWKFLVDSDGSRVSWCFSIFPMWRIFSNFRDTSNWCVQLHARYREFLTQPS